MHVVGNIAVGIHVVADVYQRPQLHLGHSGDNALHEVRIAGAQGTVADVEQRLVVMCLEFRHLIVIVLAHTALQSIGSVSGPADCGA